MEYIQLEGSDLEISRIGFGCCPMGQYGWGKTQENELIKAVQIAFDSGVNLFDTADIYGLGVSEAVLSKALGAKRKRALIASKFGVRQSEQGKTYYDNSPEWIESALIGSLRRLRTDYIDIYQLHYWDTKTPFEAIFETLEKQKSAGKIRYYGITNLYEKQLIGVTLPKELISFSLEYSLAKRTHENSIDTILKKWGLIFMSWGSMGQGIFSGRYSKATRFPENDRRSRAIYTNFHGEKLHINLLILDKMKKLLDSYPGITLPQIALRWILDRYKRSVALVGIKKPEQISENIGATGWRIQKDDLRYLDLISR